MKQRVACIKLVILLCLGFSGYGQRNKSDSLKTALKTCTVDTQKIKILNELGKLNTYKNPDTAISFLKTGLAIAGGNDYNGITINSYLFTGISYNTKGSYDSAEHYFLKAIQLAAKYKKTKLEASAYLGLGTCYNFWKKQPKALQSYQSSYKLYKSVNDSARIGAVSLGLGNVYSDIGNKEKALEFFTECLRISEARKDSGYIAKCFNNIGNLYEKNKEYEKALEYFTKSLDLKKILRDEHGIANTYTNLANVYILTDKRKLAKFFYTTAKESYLKLGDSAQYKNSLISIAECLMGEHNAKEALLNIKLAERICRKNNYIEDLTGIYAVLTRIYILLGDTGNARISLDKYLTAKDSLLSLDANKQIAEMTARYESDLQKQKINLQEAELIAGKKINRIYSITIFIFLVLIVFLLILYFKNRKAHLLLEEKNKHIEMKNKSTSRQNKD
jgi:tetratricopeptide (TPR) repeat protein